MLHEQEEREPKPQQRAEVGNGLKVNGRNGVNCEHNGLRASGNHIVLNPNSTPPPKGDSVQGGATGLGLNKPMLQYKGITCVI